MLETAAREADEGFRSVIGRVDSLVYLLTFASSFHFSWLPGACGKAVVDTGLK